MNAFHTLIFVFFLALQDGDACLGTPRVYEHTGRVGGKITLACYFDDPAQMKIFCRDGCKAEDVLLQTADEKAQHGRYSMEYRKSPIPVSITAVRVRITDLKESDSGRYSCMTNSISSPRETMEFELKVVDALQPKFTPRPFLTSTLKAPTTETAPFITSEPKQLPNITGLLDILLTPTPPAPALETPPADESNRVPEGDREDDHQDRSPPVETPVN
ncbi:uncharacterized protein LOC141799705 isoform X2 [Halichoeres trimaculatus]|uniref:uncharacterized protein LOC141799705 isoform X2 n=1 Tax=Halichoeres trimaculatus TaxID=147232 RepID=UPI003D9F8397